MDHGQRGETVDLVWFHGDWSTDRRRKKHGHLLWQEIHNDGTLPGIRRWMTVVEEGRRSVAAGGYRVAYFGSQGEDR